MPKKGFIGKPTMAKSGIDCCQCGDHIPVGIRVAGQKLCSNGRDSKKTQCQITWYAGNKKAKQQPAFVICDICGTKIVNPNNMQVRCTGDNGEASKCQAIAAGMEKAKFKSYKNEAREQLKPQKAICLKCDEPFEAEGPYNRQCPRCKSANRLVKRTPFYSTTSHIGEYANRTS